MFKYKIITGHDDNIATGFFPINKLFLNFMPVQLAILVRNLPM